MTQLEKVQNALLKNSKKSVKGVSASRLSTLTKVPLDSVHKRIYDLRRAGAKITSNYEIVKGQRKVYYKAA